MISNIFWGIILIVVGSSIALNKLYGISLPFELILAAVLIFLGISMVINARRL